MSTNYGELEPKRIIHVVNLGAFDDFSQLCKAHALDLYSDARGVFLYDLPLQDDGKPGGQTGMTAGMLEPWVQRIATFDTFVERMVTALREGPSQYDTSHHDRAVVIDEIVLCLPKEKLLEMAKKGEMPARPIATSKPPKFGKPPAKATEKAPAAPDSMQTGWVNRIRDSIARLNVDYNDQSSVVLFASETVKGGKQSKVAPAMASLLAPTGAKDLIHHFRNGIVADLANDNDATRFAALRLLIEMMLHQDLWNKVRRKPDPLLDEAAAVAVLSVMKLPDVTTSKVLAQALADALAAPPPADNGNVAANPASEDMNALSDFESATYSTIEVLVPSGTRDATQSGSQTAQPAGAPSAASGNTAAGTGQPATVAAPRSKAEGIAPPPELKLKAQADVVKGGLDATDPCATFLADLEDWQKSAFSRLQLKPDQYGDLHKRIMIVDEALDQFASRVLSNTDPVRKKHRNMMTSVRNAIKGHSSAVEAALAKARGIEPQQEATTVGKKVKQQTSALAEFEEHHQAYQRAALNAVRFTHWIGPTGLMAVAVFLAVVVGAMGVLDGLAFSFPWIPLWSDDAKHLTKIALTFLICFALIVVLSGAGVALNRYNLASRQKKLLKASNRLRDEADEAINAEYSARLHGLALSRLSLVLAKLDNCGFDTGDADAAIDFAVTESTPRFDVSWQADIRNAVEAAYHDTRAETNKGQRAKDVLQSPRCFAALPKGNLTVDLESHNSQESLPQRLTGEAIRARLGRAEYAT